MDDATDPVLEALWRAWDNEGATRADLYVILCALRDRCNELGLDEAAEYHGWFINNWATHGGYGCHGGKRA